MTSSKWKTFWLGAVKELKVLLPIFFIASLLGVLIDIYVPEEFFGFMLGENIIWSIPAAVLLGIIFPIPRYATYPIAFALFIKGIGYGVVFSLISGEVIGESVVRDVVELKYFGWRFFTARFIFSLVFISIGGYIIEWVL